MKLGMILGLGYTATRQYDDRLGDLDRRVTVREIDTLTFLRSTPEYRERMIADAAVALRRTDCTHATIGCLSYARMAFRHIAAAGMTPCCDPFTAWETLRATPGGDSLGVIATSMTFATSGFQTRFKPSPKAQRVLDDVLCCQLGLGVGMDTAREAVVKQFEELRIRGASQCLLACTDIPMDLHVQHVPRVHIVKLHEQQIRKWLETSVRGA